MQIISAIRAALTGNTNAATTPQEGAFAGKKVTVVKPGGLKVFLWRKTKIEQSDSQFTRFCKSLIRRKIDFTKTEKTMNEYHERLANQISTLKDSLEAENIEPGSDNTYDKLSKEIEEMERLTGKSYA